MNSEVFDFISYEICKKAVNRDPIQLVNIQKKNYNS
jgi:hypothetical protein